MNTQDRLRDYHPFSDQAVEQAAEVVDQQRRFGTYGEYFESVGIDPNDNPAIIDIRPKEHDPSKAKVVHLAMANPLDPNQKFGIANLASLYPNDRIIAAANPAGFGFGHNTLSFKQRVQVAKGDFRPVVENVAHYVESHGVEETEQLAASYGNDLLLAMSELDATRISGSVMVEPATFPTRSVLGLTMAFKSSEAALKGYKNANGLQIFNDARADSIGQVNYFLGLFRLTNMVTTLGIAEGGFADRLQRAHGKIGKSTLVWGSESELCPDQSAQNALSLVDNGLRLEGQKHALSNDLALMNTITATALPAD